MRWECLLRYSPNRVFPTHTTWLLLLTTLLLAGCASPRDDITAREWRAANDPEGLVRIAKAAEQGNDMRGAADFYDRALALRPGVNDAAAGLARARAAMGQPELAIAALRAAHARDPSDRGLANMLGRLEVSAGQSTQALATFQNGLRATPSDPELLIGQGVAFDKMGRHDDAQASYRQALMQDPASIAARNNLALSFALSGREQEAAALLPGLAADATARGNSAQIATIQGNIALIQGLNGNQVQAQEALRDSMSNADLDNNLRIYDRLRANLADGRQRAPLSVPVPVAVDPAVVGATAISPGVTADPPR